MTLDPSRVSSDQLCEDYKEAPLKPIHQNKQSESSVKSYGNSFVRYLKDAKIGNKSSNIDPNLTVDLLKTTHLLT